MILILLSCVLLIPALMGLGKIMEILLGCLFLGISGKVISGVLGISLIWTILSFFIPLNLYVELPTILIGIFFFFKDKLYLQFYQFSKKDTLLIAVISLITIFCSSYYPYILDHFGYYVPTIQWLAEYGLIKGISNLDLTLGQMSMWHIFQAGFSNFSDPFLRINAVLLIIYGIYNIEKKSWIQLCFLPILFLFSQSPSPDLPVIVISLIILNEILTGNKQTPLIFSFSIFVFAVKPTMIWLPIFSFSYGILIIKSNFKNYIPGILILILFFIKNIWTFGYPVFPVAVGNMGVYWQPNAEVLKTSSQFALQKTYDMQYSFQQIQNFSSFDYIKNWLFLNGIKSKINILFIISLITFIIYSFVKKNKTTTLLCLSLLIKSTLVVLFSAQYRFFIDVFFVIFFVVFLDHFTKKKSIVIFSIVSLFFICFLSFPNLIQQYLPSFRLGSFMGKFEKEQLYKPSTYEYHSFNSFKVGNLQFNISKNYPYNFDTPLPAVSSSYIFDDVKAGIFPQLIDEKNIKKGFIWKKMNRQQKNEAEKVINTIKYTDK
ncbi:hypothetical protein M2347_000650 [Chryseobacterium sp. H1D6B]|uniref:LIC_10190 family membrane protein n=1 Tax=Chryseobacterium sp. H1D6B TaxID=2940588 RepID=UPI0015C6BC7B|nr:hypothetical protein [Chryseobacterium sp. H1D6B]MDH6250923.1 hypothetical protein [Chryseobacterium sp. H1D6B]